MGEIDADLDDMGEIVARPGQYELTLNYRKEAMQAADDLILLKRLVRAQARRHGVTACFMAKPIEKYAGSGMFYANFKQATTA